MEKNEKTPFKKRCTVCLYFCLTIYLGSVAPERGYFSAGNPSASQILVKTSIALSEKNTCRLHRNTGRNKYALHKTVEKPHG
jgi:hypothetical protein